MDRLLCGGFIAYNTSFVCTPENNVRVLPWFALPVPCWIGLPPRTCCVGQYVFKGGQALPFLFENGRVSRMGMFRKWACLENGRVSRMGVSREWACLESGRVSRVGVSREWAQCVQNHCFCKVFQNRCAQNHCFCKVLCKRGLKNHCFCKVFHKHFRRGWWSNRRNYFAYGAQPPSPSHLLVQRQWPAVAHHIGTHRIPIYISIHRASERAPLNISI